MAKYIDKSALVAEIKKRRDKNARNKLNLAASFEDNYLLSFIDTLKVKEVKESADAFIEKAKEFIWSHTEGSDYHVNYVLKEFENFMKGE